MTRRGELRLVQLVVVTLVLEQLTMASLLDDVAVFHDEDEVSVPDSGEAMGDDEASTLLAQVCHRLLNEHLGAGVHRTSGFVKDE